MKLLTILTAVLLSASTAVAGPTLIENPKSTVGHTYDDFRQKLAYDGWEPQRIDGGPGSCFDDPTRYPCNIYPEAEDCSGSGLAYCTMKWTRDGQTITILTGGELDRRIVEVE